MGLAALAAMQRQSALLREPGIEQIEYKSSQIIPQNQQDSEDDNGDEEEDERKFDDALAAVGWKRRLSGHGNSEIRDQYRSGGRRWGFGGGRGVGGERQSKDGAGSVNNF